ncbi:MAG TPA: helicase-related protein [Ktedonobacteraceae bacterium]|jgi:superfamily II DNA or RNA helicase
MPHIFDNIEHHLLPALQETLKVSQRADFCVGYFNLRGWQHLDQAMEHWQASAQGRCRLLIGMAERPEDELRRLFSLREAQEIDQASVLRLKERMAREFRQQLLTGAPSNADQEGLRRLSEQLQAGRVVVKLFVRHKLHAKLYLLYQQSHITPIVGYLGSSNLTLAGLQQQGELNIDVLDSDACQKLERWFQERWEDRWCLDISAELAEIIDESWAREQMPPPYYIYLKMAYHLSQEARAGLQDFSIPAIFKNQLFEYQVAAVKIAAHHLNKRGGVLIGDVVGLGKTLMATALARVMQDDAGLETLVICPKNLVGMWQDVMHEYGLVHRVASVTNVHNELPGLRRFRLVIIDESHNLRNREGRRYRAIKEYIEKNESKCILLSATPYNKTYLDLSAQLRLFLSEERCRDLGIRPERLLSSIGEARFNSQFQCPVRSLTAFEKSEYADDWRDLMRLYLVRRTRSFIQEHYTRTDAPDGRPFLLLSDGRHSSLPLRRPHTITFPIDETQTSDPYATLYAQSVVTTINSLTLPRYGLANYIARLTSTQRSQLCPVETRQLANLSHAGKRLMGFCRTNLFKRLESGGPAFLQSLERHVLRNFVYLHAIEAGLDLPIGTQGAELLDARTHDEDAEALPGEHAGVESTPAGQRTGVPERESACRQLAAEIYAQYAGPLRKRFKWLRPALFTARLKRDLLADARSLLHILEHCGSWEVSQDTKLRALIVLLTQRHPHEKVLIFSQFADTVRYLAAQLKACGIDACAGVTGEVEDPTALVWRFSPVSNRKREAVACADELRVLIATDVLSEGQNLQDAAIVVNYDLPWAIIRLIQRAGRVDRIGQQADTIHCYSFLPADGIERLIRLRERVQARLQQNAEVVGTDEVFFEDELQTARLLDLYNEKAGILDDETDNEVDLASQAYQIWKNAIDANPGLKGIIEHLPDVMFSTRAHRGSLPAPAGVLVYLRTSQGNDALAWINQQGESVTQSHLAILRAAACSLDTPAITRPSEQHELVQRAVAHIIAEETRSIGGQLGAAHGARYKTYTRLKAYIDATSQTLFPPAPELQSALADIYIYPLQETARDTLKRQLRSGATDAQLAAFVIDLRAANRLCQIQEQQEPEEPRILCSLGLFEPG